MSVDLVFKFVTLMHHWSGASRAGCVFRAKSNKKWTRGHGMRPSSMGYVLETRDKSDKFPMRLFLSPLSFSFSRDSPNSNSYLTFLTKWRGITIWIKHQMQFLRSPNFLSSLSIFCSTSSSNCIYYFYHIPAFVYCQTQPITPPLMLPPLHHETDNTVAVSQVWPVSPVVFNGLVTDEVGAVSLQLVLTGRLRWKAGGMECMWGVRKVNCIREKRERRERKRMREKRKERERGERNRRIRIKSKMSPGSHAKHHVSNFY
ncbi:hypothetical protein Hanom_Chr15g01371661 [Helianthus anomalus]